MTIDGTRLASAVEAAAADLVATDTVEEDTSRDTPAMGTIKSRTSSASSINQDSTNRRQQMRQKELLLRMDQVQPMVWSMLTSLAGNCVLRTRKGTPKALSKEANPNHPLMATLIPKVTTIIPRMLWIKTAKAVPV